MTPVIDKVASPPAAKSGTNGHPRRQPTRDELVDELMRTEGKAEIIGGRVVRFMASGDLPGMAAFNIGVALRVWQRSTGASGRAGADGTGFLCDLPNRQSFEPDASFYTGARSGARFLPEPPVFAVEVRSEGDYGVAMETELEKKRADYCACETEVVWDVDVLRGEEIVRKYTKAGGATTPVAVYKRGEIADAEPAVPRFSLPVDDLFE